MSIVTIHQPNYIPWLGFFHKVAQADLFVSLDNVQFATRGFTHRNSIRGAQGSLLLTVPIHQKGSPSDRICDLRIASEQTWAKSHFHSLERSYRRAPFWSEYEPFLRSVYLEQDWTHLADLNETIIRYLFQVLAIDTPLIKASTLPVTGASTELLIQITKSVGASTYLSGPSGHNYLDEGRFADEGLSLRYHQFEHPVYQQRHAGEFVPNLSIWDLVLQHGPNSRAILLNEPILVAT